MEVEDIKKEKLPEVIEQIEKVQGEIIREFDSSWIAEIGEPRFAQVQESNSEVSLRDRFLLP